MRYAILAWLSAFVMAAAFAQEDRQLPDNVLELRQLANQAHANGERELFRSAVRRLHELRPNNSEYMYQLVLAHAALGELTPAFNMMLQMQRQGLSYDFDQSPDSMNMRHTNLYPYLNDLMIKAGNPLGEISPVARLDADVGRVEAIDWDASRQAFLVGTVTDGRLLAVGEDGTFRELLRADRDNGLWGIYDLAVDAERNRLWLTSSSTPQFSGFDPVDQGRSALFELELDSLQLVRRYPVPVDGLPHNLGKMAMAASGELFFADRTLPIIYRLRPGEDRLSPVFATPELISLRGIAVSDDATALYVADYELGIVRLGLESGDVALLGRAETLNLGGVDGVEYLDGDLLIIQNGIRPQRIMRLALDDSGTRVENVTPVAVALEAFDRPHFGTLVGEELVFFANSQGAAPEPQPVLVARVGTEGVGVLMTPDMQRFLEQQAKRREQLLEEAGQTEDPAVAGAMGEDAAAGEAPAQDAPVEDAPAEDAPAEAAAPESGDGGG